MSEKSSANLGVVLYDSLVPIVSTHYGAAKPGRSYQIVVIGILVIFVFLLPLHQEPAFKPLAGTPTAGPVGPGVLPGLYQHHFNDSKAEGEANASGVSQTTTNNAVALPAKSNGIEYEVELEHPHGKYCPEITSIMIALEKNSIHCKKNFEDVFLGGSKARIALYVRCQHDLRREERSTNHSWHSGSHFKHPKSWESSWLD